MEQQQRPPSRFQRLERLALPLTLVAALLPAVQPLLQGQLPRFDAVFHLYRLAQLERAVLHGTLFPRWFPDLGLGYGFPLFNYYAPLSYYLALPLRLLGFSFEATLLGGFVLGHLALVAGTYLWTREGFGKSAALGAALLIGYAPYPLLNLHYRGAFAEVWGLACLAWALWAVQRLSVRGGRLPFVLTALCSAALMLSHNVMALLGMPLLAGYALLLAWQHPERKAAALRLFLALGLGAGLSAFFWAPALREQAYVQIHQIQIYDYREHFLTLGELFSGPTPTVKGEVTPYVPHSVGWILPLLAAGAFFPNKKTLPASARFQKWALLAVALVLLGMTLPISAPLWEKLPLLSFVQFPWRFLGPVSLGLAVLGGVGLERLPGPAAWRLPLALAAVSLFALTWLFPPYARPQPPLTPPALLRIEQETGGLGTTTAGDYLPIWVQERPGDELLALYTAAAEDDYLIPRLDPTTLPEGAQLLAEKEALNATQVTLETPVAFRARFRWYYFPGWQVRIDGALAPTLPDGPHGLLAVEVPAGKHTLEVHFGETPLRRAADAISLVSAALLVVGTWGMGKGKGVMGNGEGVMGNGDESDSMPHHPSPVTHHSSPITHHPSPLTDPPSPVALYLALGCIGLSLFAVKSLYLDRHDTLFHPWDFDGQHLRGVDAPLQVRFGDDVALMGYDLATPTLATDQPAALTLYWRVLHPTTADYSVAVHLVDAWGRLYGQEDHQHPNGYPTSLLQTDEFIRDTYTFTPFAGTPPGEHYTLLVTVYEASTGRQVDVWDSGGQWRGTAYPLTELTVSRPEAFPAPETLPLAQRLDADLGTGLRLLGTGDLPASVEVGNDVLVTLFWQAQATPAADARVRLQLVDVGGAVAAQLEAPPGRPDLPTSRWLSGEVIRDGHSFLIPAARFDVPTCPLESGPYLLRAGLFNAAGEPLGASVTLGELAVIAPERRFDSSGRTPLARFGDFAALLEAELAPEVVTPGQTLVLTLSWRAEAPAQGNYTLFVHLLNEAGAPIAQRDTAPGAGRRPTPSWFTAEVITDTCSLVVPPETPPGRHTLKIGFYDPDTYARLPVTDGTGQAMGDGMTWAIEVISPSP
ncbi:MAG TPA: 6-pyruvoyl-tetrahydropterin synthase-related protein [Anaerolineae bacterium]|nr:6-pyruvoyl-tetrahydropterin synthase-related protein [Anaerolineae bacterium]